MAFTQPARTTPGRQVLRGPRDLSRSEIELGMETSASSRLFAVRRADVLGEKPRIHVQYVSRDGSCQRIRTYPGRVVRNGFDWHAYKGGFHATIPAQQTTPTPEAAIPRLRELVTRLHGGGV